ncbi:unnamed protein product [Ectocarpus sp. 12 AP-2014]
MAPRLHNILDTFEIVRLIHREGADVGRRDIDGTTALHASRSSAVARTLIEYGADVNAKSSRGMSPLHRTRSVGVAKVLVERGASVNATDNFGNTPLHYSNDIGTVRLLLQHGASVNHRNVKGETPIHMSTYGSKVTALAEAGADVDAVDNTGKTLLMKKSRCFYGFRLLDHLLKLNPCIFLKDMDGKTAIDFTVDELVNRRLQVYWKDQNWRRRKTLLLLRARRNADYVAKDALVLLTMGLPHGVFRLVLAYL